MIGRRISIPLSCTEIPADRVAEWRGLSYAHPFICSVREIAKLHVDNSLDNDKYPRH